MLSQERFDHFVSKARVSLQGALEDQEAADAMATYGYTPDRIQGILDRLDEAEEAAKDQQVEVAEKEAATDHLQILRKAAYHRLSRHRRLCRLTFEGETEAYRALALRGNTERTHGPMMQQATTFYNVLKDDATLRRHVEPLSLTLDTVNAALASLQEITDAATVRTVETKEAEAATQERDEIFADVRGEMVDFFEVADIATEGTQIGEAMNMKRSRA